MTTDVTIVGGSRGNDKLALTDLSEMTDKEIEQHLLERFAYAKSQKSWRGSDIYYALQNGAGCFVGYRNTISGVIVGHEMDRWGDAGTSTYNLDGTFSQDLVWVTHQAESSWSNCFNAMISHDPEVENWDIVQLQVRDCLKGKASSLYMIDAYNSCVDQPLNGIFDVVHVLQKGIKEIPAIIKRTLTNAPIEMANKIEEMII